MLRVVGEQCKSAPAGWVASYLSAAGREGRVPLVLRISLRKLLTEFRESITFPSLNNRPLITSSRDTNTIRKILMCILWFVTCMFGAKLCVFKVVGNIIYL